MLLDTPPGVLLKGVYWFICFIFWFLLSFDLSLSFDSSLSFDLSLSFHSSLSFDSSLLRPQSQPKLQSRSFAFDTPGCLPQLEPKTLIRSREYFCSSNWPLFLHFTMTEWSTS